MEIQGDIFDKQLLLYYAMRLHACFTLIELIVVVIIISILAVIAVPKFIDSASDARTSAINSIAGSLSAASVINYAARKVNSAKGVPVANCTV